MLCLCLVPGLHGPQWRAVKLCSVPCFCYCAPFFGGLQTTFKMQLAVLMQRARATWKTDSLQVSIASRGLYVMTNCAFPLKAAFSWCVPRQLCIYVGPASCKQKGLSPSERQKVGNIVLVRLQLINASLRACSHTPNNR